MSQKPKDYTMVAFGLVILIAVLASIHPQHTPPPKPSILGDYQIRLTIDSAYIYDNGRLVDSCAYGKDGIDSLIFKDNL